MPKAFTISFSLVVLRNNILTVAKSKEVGAAAVAGDQKHNCRLSFVAKAKIDL